MNEEKYLDSNELAERWRLKKETLANWRNRGKGPKYVKLTPRKILYPLSAVEKWESENLKGNTAA